MARARGMSVSLRRATAESQLQWPAIPGRISGPEGANPKAQG
jgi:hypothetical protein